MTTATQPASRKEKAIQTTTERAMQEKDSYCWSFIGGKIEVRTPGTDYKTPYTITDDGCGNLTCSCPQGKKYPVCKHTESYRIDWQCRIPAAAFATAKNHFPAFTCDQCSERTFGSAVKPCATSGLNFCDEGCMEMFFDAVEDGRMDSLYRNLAAEARL